MKMAEGDLTGELSRKYWVECLTIEEISIQYGRHPDTIRDWFRKSGVSLRDPKEVSAHKKRAVKPAEVDAMVEMYNAGASSNDVGAKCGRDGRLVRTHLKSRGVLRGKKESVRLAVDNGKIRSTELDQKFFDVFSPQMAWVLGLLYGDGHVANDPKLGQYQVFLAGSEEVCAKAQLLLGMSKAARKDLKSNCWILQFSSRRLVGRLGELGLTGGSKAKTMTFPSIPKDMLPHFVRGLWDSDGHWNKGGSASYSCASIQFVDSFIEVLTAMGMLPRKHESSKMMNDKKFSWHDIGLRNGDTAILREWVYSQSNSSIQCDRKHRLANELSVCNR